jgi:hypothetical protein
MEPNLFHVGEEVVNVYSRETGEVLEVSAEQQTAVVRWADGKTALYGFNVLEHTVIDAEYKEALEPGDYVIWNCPKGFAPGKPEVVDGAIGVVEDVLLENKLSNEWQHAWGKSGYMITWLNDAYNEKRAYPHQGLIKFEDGKNAKVGDHVLHKLYMARGVGYVDEFRSPSGIRVRWKDSPKTSVWSYAEVLMLIPKPSEINVQCSNPDCFKLGNQPPGTPHGEFNIHGTQSGRLKPGDKASPPREGVNMDSTQVEKAQEEARKNHQKICNYDALIRLVNQLFPDYVKEMYEESAFDAIRSILKLVSNSGMTLNDLRGNSDSRKTKDDGKLFPRGKWRKVVRRVPSDAYFEPGD